MISKAKVYRHDRSPYWQAWFEVWDAKQERWKPKLISTRCTDEAKALEIAQSFEKVALEAGGMKARLSRDRVVEAVNGILLTAGHRPVVDQKKWSDYSEAWLAAQKRRVPKDLGKGSWTTYQNHVTNFTTWLGGEASITLNAIDGDMLTEWYSDTLATGLKSSTANQMANTLNSIFERARDEGFTQRNPVRLLDREAADSEQRDDFTEEQMWKIIHHLQASKDKIHQQWLTIALLGFCTSQRLGDCRKSVRTAFSFTDPWIIWTLTPRKTARTTRKTLRIPIVEPAASHIRKLLAVKNPASLFLAPDLADDSLAWDESPSAQFMAILEECGISGRRVEGQGKGHSFNSLSFHSTRHTCNSLLANADVPFELRKQITGHAKLATNIIYTHYKDATKAAALSKAFQQKTTPKKKKVS